MELALITLSIGSLIFFAYLFTSLFEKYQIPDVLFLLSIGLILGPITHLVDIEQFGILGDVFATLTLLIILFDAGLNIKIKGILGSASRASALMFSTLLISTAIVTPIGYFFFGLAILESIFVALIVGGISAGIVIPIANKLPVQEETKRILALESNINDIVTVSIILAFVNIFNGGIFDFKSFSIDFGVGFITALVVGILMAVIWSQLIKSVRGIENNIFMTPALVLIVFGASELLGISGVIAAFAFGITLGNLQFTKFERLPRFLEFEEFTLTNWEKNMFKGFVFILKTYFFVYIGLSIPLNNLLLILGGAGVMVLLFGARIISVKMFINSDTPKYDKDVLIRLLPKGLVGAALVTLVDNQMIQDLTYSIIMFSIVFTSILIFLIPEKEIEESKEELETQTI
ncbi:MAG: cation:proton antiporter [Candidatus Paceibacterota bacterium]